MVAVREAETSAVALTHALLRTRRSAHFTLHNRYRNEPTPAAELALEPPAERRLTRRHLLTASC